MESEFIKYLISQGGIGILSVIMFIAYKKQSERHEKYLAGQNEIERGRTEMIIQVLRETAVAITRNTTIVDSFHRRLDRDEV